MLKPSEIILGLDQPSNKECIQVAKAIAAKYDTNLRIVEIERNTEYKMHQAWARRKCFREAKYNVILTGDTDLHVYPACLKAIELVGKDGIGLVSLMKKRNVRTIGGITKNFIHSRINAYHRKRGIKEKQEAYFTGLYCIYRPYWLDSEDESSIKNMPHPYDAPLLMDSWGGYKGEDTHLHDQMKMKFKCVYLPDIGAEDQRPGLEERKQIQTKIGMKYAYEGASPITVFEHSLFNLRFHVFRSYIKQLKEIHGNNISSQAYKIAIAGFFFDLMRVMLKKELTLKSMLALRMQEFPTSVLLTKEKGQLFVDVGANRGYYSLLLRNNFDRILCFEPAASFDDLVKNIASFRAESNIRAEKIAISNSDGEGIFSLALYSRFSPCVAAEQLVANSEVALHGDGRVLGIEKAKKTTITTYFRNEKFIDLIKVDVGGSEWEVLEGAIPIIDRIGTWIVELYNTNRLVEMQEWFIHYGYHMKLLSHSAKTCHIMASRKAELR